MSTFKHDLFISYAHIDNQPLGDQSEGWIAQLHTALMLRLPMLLGENPNIWRDPKLGGADFFDDEIRDALNSAALMLAIFSPRYLRADYCRYEVAQFLEHAKQSGGLRVGNKSRLIKVIKTPVPLKDHPVEIQEVLGFEFYELDSNGRHHEFNKLFGTEWGDKFWQKLEDLAQELAQLLRAMNFRALASDRTEVDTIDNGFTIYLGQATCDLIDIRENVRRELEQRGHRVLPDRQISWIGSEVKKQLQEALAHADLAIHFVGRHYGLVPEELKCSIQELENITAAQYSRERGLPRLIWLPPSLTVDDERQRSFVDMLRNDHDAQLGADLLETPLEELKTVLLNTLVQMQQPKPILSSSENENNLTRVYLIYDEHDEENTVALEDYLWSVENTIEILRPLFGGEPVMAREEHEENLRICDAALIYYGQASEGWLRTKLRDLRKAPGLGRSRPIWATAVYLAPPLDKRKERFRSREVEEIIRPHDGFQLADLQAFLHKLKTGKKEATS